ncbi:hypothetical protein FSP39_002045, partial [Pinctada imbricata]
QIRKEVHRVYDRIYACIYGQCIGDTLGLLTESLTKEEAKKRYKEVHHSLEIAHKKLVPDVHRRKWSAGDWTDETDQMILILQSILRHKGEVLYALFQVNPVDFAKHLMDWTENGFPELGDECGYGASTQIKSVVSHHQFSEKPCKAAEIVWRDSSSKLADNSAVARTSVIGVHHYNALGKVIKNAIDICVTTHADPRCQASCVDLLIFHYRCQASCVDLLIFHYRCQASCVAVSTAVSLMLQRNLRHLKKNEHYDVEALVEECYTYASRLLPTYAEVKELKYYMYPNSLKDLHLDEPGRSNFTYKALGAGFWALRQKNFRQSIQDIVLEGGDADANCAVAGALLGCKLGVESIPRTWIEPLLHRFWLDNLMDRYDKAICS